MIPEHGEASNLGFKHRFVPSKGSKITLLLLHGTGGDENNLLPLGGILLPGAALLSPRGKVLENGMPRFFRRLSEGVFDNEDLTYRTHELAEFVKHASKAYGFNIQKVVAVGYSNGANIAASAFLLHPRLLAGAVLFRPMIPFTPKETPDLSGRRILIEAGTEDTIIPGKQPEELARLFRKGDADVSLVWHDSDHSLIDEEIVVAREWLSIFS